MILPDRRTYERDGVVAARGVLGQAEVGGLLEQLRELLSQPSVVARQYGPDADNPFRVDTLLSLRCPLLRSLVLASNISRLATHLIGQTGKTHFFYDQLFYKGPSCPSRTQWHQDLPFWPLEGENIPSLWLALTEITTESSPVRYLVGSHRSGLRFLPRDPGDGSDLPGSCPDYDAPETAKPWRVTSFELSPGDVVAHHPLLVHGAGPNITTRERAGISVRYFSGDTVWSPRPGAMFFPGISAIITKRSAVSEWPKLFPQIENNNCELRIRR